MIWHAFGQLTPARQQLYIALLQALGKTAIPCDAAPEDIHAVLKAILLDHPQLCFFGGKWAYENKTVYPHYELSQNSTQILTLRAKNLSDRLPEGDYPRQVYAWMLENIAYDLQAPHSQNAYGALVQRRAVCKGIAKAYQLLMAQRDIPCILVEGTLDGISKHVWNMICLDGKWLHVDVTMGYPSFRRLVGAEDAWGGYLLTTENISRSHGIRNIQDLPNNETEDQKWR